MCLGIRCFHVKEFHFFKDFVRVFNSYVEHWGIGLKPQGEIFNTIIITTNVN